MIKFTVMVIVVLCLVFAALGLAQPQRSGKSVAPGTVRYVARWDPQQSGVMDRLNTVYFVNPMLGWAAGDHNVLIRTTDGGNAWKPLMERQDRGEDFHSIVFSSETEGSLQGSHVLLHTTDAGESWQPANDLPGDYGFGGGSVVPGVRYQMKVHNMGAGVFRSADDGRTWEALAADLPRNDYTTVFFLDSDHGWVSGDYGHFAVTQDGGKTWKPVELGEGRLEKIQFRTPQHGWMLAVLGKAGPFVTTDGGLTWTNQYAVIATSHNMLDLQFLSENDGFLLSQEGVHHTSNGGKNCSKIATFTTYRALSFPRVDEGLAVGERGGIQHYHLVPLPEK